jgi:myosin heavy subunit
MKTIGHLFVVFIFMCVAMTGSVQGMEREQQPKDQKRKQESLNNWPLQVMSKFPGVFTKDADDVQKLIELGGQLKKNRLPDFNKVRDEFMQCAGNIAERYQITLSPWTAAPKNMAPATHVKNVYNSLGLKLPSVIFATLESVLREKRENEEKLIELEVGYKQLSENHLNLTKNLNEMSQSYKDSFARLTSEKELQRDSNEKQVERLQSTMRSIEKRSLELETEITELNKRLASATQENENITAAKTKLEKEQEQNQRELAEVKVSLTQTQESLGSVNEEMTKLRSQSAQQKLEDGNQASELQKVKLELEKKGLEIAKLKDNAIVLEKLTEEMKKDLTKKEAEHKELLEQKKTLEETLRCKDELHSQLQNTFKTKTDELVVLQKTLETANAEKATEVREAQGLRAHIQEMLQQLSNCLGVPKAENPITSMVAFIKKIEELKAAKGGPSDREKQLNDEIGTLRTELQEGKKVVDLADKKVAAALATFKSDKLAMYKAFLAFLSSINTVLLSNGVVSTMPEIGAEHSLGVKETFELFVNQIKDNGARLVQELANEGATVIKLKREQPDNRQSFSATQGAVIGGVATGGFLVLLAFMLRYFDLFQFQLGSASFAH